MTRKEFFCLPDAQAAAKAFQNGAFHQVSFSFESRPVYSRGRPSKSGARQVKEIRHRVLVNVSENNGAVEKLREEAGCFVLLTNVPTEKISGLETLTIYKEQDGIEKNFGFLKDPLVANDVFLKKPHRIEAMGLVLVLSLLLWRLMERTMRRKTKQENITLQGWNNSTAIKPTSFIMVSHPFSLVSRMAGAFCLHRWIKCSVHISVHWKFVLPHLRKLAQGLAVSVPGPLDKVLKK